MHDRIAELGGLRDELARCQTTTRESTRARADQVREQIDRVREDLAAEVETLEQRAQDQAADGQDVPAALSATAARDLRAALDADDPAPDPAPDPAAGAAAGSAKGGPGAAGKRNTAAAKAPEKT